MTGNVYSSLLFIHCTAATILSVEHHINLPMIREGLLDIFAVTAVNFTRNLVSLKLTEKSAWKDLGRDET